jgi:hypothetical protein
VFPSDPEIFPDQSRGGNSAQTDQNFRLYQSNLIVEIADAGILLHFLGVTIVRRAAFDDVRNVAILFAVKVNDTQHIIQQLSCTTHKGLSLQIFLLSRTFAHEHDLTFPVAYTEYYIVPCGAKPATVATAAGIFKACPVHHLLRLLLCLCFL